MTTTRDHIAATIQKALPIVVELAKQEAALRDSGNIQNRQERARVRDEARQQAKVKREDLYSLREPAAICQYLEATEKFTEKASATEFKAAWQGNETQVNCLGSLADEVQKLYESHFRQPIITDLDGLPLCSFALQFTLVLEQPLLTKDEQEFYIIDNPVRKDKTFRLPYITPSSWKGCLRAALWRLGYTETHESVRRLFGNEKGSEAPDLFRAGRLQFFPTFFPKKSLEIINPHDRVRKVGINPILIESVPQGADGCFTLLYVPFDRVGEDRNEIRREVAEDLRVLAKGLHAMFRQYGFGAKTSSGFGTAEEKLKEDSFKFKINCNGTIPTVPGPSPPTAKARPKTAVKSLAELGAAIKQPGEGSEKGVGFKELTDYLAQVADSLIEQGQPAMGEEILNGG